MKRITLILAILMTTPIFILAQTARVQVIHNSADAAASSVDIYLNSTLALESVNYKTATEFLDLPADAPITIDIVPAGMGLMSSVYDLTTTLTSGETYVIVADGIVSATGYSPAPAFGLEVYAMGREMANDPANTDVLVHHGSTDAPTVDVYEQSGTELADNLMYTDFAGYLELPTDDYYLQLRDETGATTLLAYDAPLASLELDGAAITVVASGFLAPENNSDGDAFGLFAITAEGGDFIPLDMSTARAQVIHNAADADAEMVDVYLNGSLLLDDFAFRTATPYVDLPAGIGLEIDIAPGSSMDVSESIYNMPVSLMADETYVIVADGIVSATGYSPAPAFGLEVYAMGREMANDPANTDVLVHHGSTDAPTVDVYEQSGTELADNLMYTDFAGYIELPTDDYYLQLRDETGATTLLAYDAPLASLELDGAAITVVASGFLAPENNSDGDAFGLFAITAAGGDFIPLDMSTARAQVIHNAADANAEMVDVYLNGSLLLDDFAFRTATPYVDLPAGVGIEIDIAPGSSMDVSESIYNMPVSLMADETYVIVADGIVSATGYSPAPAFGLEVYAMGREMASDPANTDVLVHHGSTDAPTVDVYEQSGLELADNLMYTDFAGYLELPTDDYVIELREETGMTTLLVYNAPLSSLGLDGAAITVFASGFLAPENNMDREAFGLYVALSDGTVVPLEQVTLSISDNNIISDDSFSIYPNPAVEQVNMSFNMEQSGNIDIQIFNINGQKIISTSYNNLQKGQNSLTLPISSLDTGIYQVQLMSDSYSTVKSLQIIR